MHLYGYGGFGISMLPYYNPALGKLWLERGGTGVVANIRGGGEFGTAWHEAGAPGRQAACRTTISPRSPPTSCDAASRGPAASPPRADRTAGC